MKTYQIRLFPTKEKIDQLNELSSIRTEVWNKLLDIQKESYELNKSIYNKFDLNNMLPELKEKNLSWKKLNSKALQTISTELFGSYRSFFNLIKKDKNARPPKKIENKDYHTITWNQSGWIIKDNNEIIINKINFRYKSNINISELNIKEIRIKYSRNKWLCDLVVNDKIEYKNDINIKTNVLAFDLGLSKLATGVDNKGNQIIVENKSKRINKYFQKQISRIQKKSSKTKKGSIRNLKFKKDLNKLYQKKNEQIKQTLHIQSKKLANMDYNTIIVGDLSVKKLMEKEGTNKNKRGIRKSFHQSNINMFLQFLSYKCQNKNINLTKIDEKWTTQLNCLTGKLFDKKAELSDREVKLSNEITIDRDLNSAINIMKRWFENQFASMNEPLDISNVLRKYNLSKETHKSLVCV
ncbi:MAG: transposase [Gammaproteobacteria bacterium]|nr:transposase [Gammaproteobacteria bacterium]